MEPYDKIQRKICSVVCNPTHTVAPFLGDQHLMPSMLQDATWKHVPDFPGVKKGFELLTRVSFILHPGRWKQLIDNLHQSGTHLKANLYL